MLIKIRVASCGAMGSNYLPSSLCLLSPTQSEADVALPFAPSSSETSGSASKVAPGPGGSLGPRVARLSSQTGELQLGHPQRLGLMLSSQMERVKGRVGHPGWCVGCRDKGQKCSDSRSPKGV